MKVGEIIHVENPNKMRLYWPLAKVELLPGRNVVVGMEKVPESSTPSEKPVTSTDQEVNPKLTKVTPAKDSCKFLRCGR
ncbi:hypothetical protein TNCT_224521 [Trichonephila clavata]|uniref:DUF5641 domain-containing protein n=1 Tax=Trichonephila clavata TaxID=2740835 RepID=A0A8X6FX97_TRICU|nr:hypothetical protein TNCT_224521 [Trichonephila clavata]